MNFAKLLLIIFALFIRGGLSAQSAPYCPSVNAQAGTGPSTTICQGQCVNLTASVVPVNLTNTYSVQSIPYAPFPFAGTSILANNDDLWSPLLNIGFNFCYFGNTFSQYIVGSNGQLTFSTSLAGGYDNWSISAALPSLTNMPGNTICAAFRDIDPTSSGNIYYATSGTAPCRSLIITWNNIPMFSNPGSCSGVANSTFQLVLHETTNYIDVFIQNSSACPGWNSGAGIVGIQNANATLGYSPPSRNYPTAWTAINEGWRFVPNAAQTYTVTWSSPSGTVATGLTANVCPTVSTTYTATMNVSACAGAISTYTSPVTVSVTPGPTLTVNSPTICQGSSATLNAGGAATYTWLPGGSNASSVTFTPATTTNYTLTGSLAGFSCIGTLTTAITVNSVNPSNPSSNSPICAGNTLSLSVASANSYSWSGPNGFTSNLQNPTIAGASTLATGTYTATLTGAGGCTSTNTVAVVVLPLPNPVANNNGPLCTGSTLNLMGGGSLTYTWTGPNGFSSNLQNPSINNVSTLASGIYTLMIGAASCSAVTTTSVTINANPTASITSNSPVCLGQAMNLNGSGGVNYAWFGPTGYTSSAQNPIIPIASITNSGTYSLTVTDVNGCTNTTSANFVVNPLPAVTATGASVCVNQSVNLSSNGAVNYAWTGPNGFTSNAQNPLISNATAPMAGVYTVTGTDANSCSNTATATVLVNVPPAPNVASNSPICINNILNLYATGGVNYAWSGPNGFTSIAQNPTITANTTAYSGNYTVTASDAIGCSTSSVITVTVNPVPSANIVSGPNKGCAPLCVTFTCASAGVQSCTWTFGDGASATSSVASNCYITPGIYTVSASVTDNNGCSSVATMTVNSYPIPVADFVYSPISPIINDVVTFSDASHNANVTSWNWYFMNTTQYQAQTQNPTFIYAEMGSYVIALVVKSDHGCKDTLLKTITVGEDFGVYVPDAFTPNDDGLNDYFQPKGFGITKYEMDIFDRWGQRIFHTTDFTNGWDGKLNGKGERLPEGVYVWKIRLTNVFGKSKEMTGHVTLIK